MEKVSGRRPSLPGGAAVGLAIVLVAMNLRPAFASVGPVLVDIRADLGLSATVAALLTVLPLVCFGTVALAAPVLARRFGTRLTVTAVLAAIVGGLVLRVGPWAWTLFAGTLVAGAAIAIVNVLLPALTKGEFGHRAGIVMGLYLSVMSATAAIAAGVTVPLARLTGLGWRGGLGVWALPAVIALLCWLALVPRGQLATPGGHVRSIDVAPALTRDLLAWQVTAYFGLQSLGFYSVLSWLPSVYRSYDVDPTTAGVLLSIVVILGVPLALFVPSALTRAAHQRHWVMGTSAITGTGLLGVLVSPTTGTYLWAVLLGIGLGLAFPLAMTLVVLRARDVSGASRLSAMSQSVGYLLAATGPLLFGALHDATGGWRLPLSVLLFLLAVQTAAGVRAGRPLTVGGGGRRDAEAERQNP